MLTSYNKYGLFGFIVANRPRAAFREIVYFHEAEGRSK